MSYPFAVIFDWDGVVIDSSSAHERSWERLAEELGRPLPADHFLRGFGMRNQQIFPEILGWEGDEATYAAWGDRKEELYREVLRDEGIEPLPGLRELIEQLEYAGAGIAVGSSTPRANLDCVMELIGLRDPFTVVVSGDDVQRGKPDPEVFLRAAAGLGVPVERAVVIEDAPVGVIAAHAGGFRVVGVHGSHPPARLEGAELVVPDLTGLDPGRLLGLLG